MKLALVVSTIVSIFSVTCFAQANLANGGSAQKNSNTGRLQNLRCEFTKYKDNKLNYSINLLALPDGWPTESQTELSGEVGAGLIFRAHAHNDWHMVRPTEVRNAFLVHFRPHYTELESAEPKMHVDISYVDRTGKVSRIDEVVNFTEGFAIKGPNEFLLTCD